ncbi:MAG: hypothetical protein CMO20_04485 [Thermoplasmata archaeon]|nr:hypothetical protein [Thermoplasmata archaeon]|tara:strand:+ start:446 stop:910 length:465 start_codon:yes stop_codon:yes gene_type:complete
MQLVMGGQYRRTNVRMDPNEDDGPRWIDIPSIHDGEMPRPEPGQLYHDLGNLYPDAPVPKSSNEIVIRRAVLHDVTGLEEILNWAADGQIAIVELGKIIDRGFEFETAIEKITNFIVGDLGGSLVQLGDERVLILPPNASGVAGLEKEAHEGHS